MNSIESSQLSSSCFDGEETTKQSLLSSDFLDDDNQFTDSKLSIDSPHRLYPEGSIEGSPPVKGSNENATPPYWKWAENIEYLLNDEDGVALFRQFLEQENQGHVLEFHFACKGFKTVSHDAMMVRALAKSIHKKYIRGEGDTPHVSISADLRRTIQERIRSKDYSIHIFDLAEKEISVFMARELYPAFLKSDVYVQYLQSETGSPKEKSGAQSSGSMSARPISTILPTVKEDEILNFVPLTSKNILATSQTRSGDQKRVPVDTIRPSHAPNPYHVVGYAPACSQRDSERQSLSSDALTDDNRSLTDSSISMDRGPSGRRRTRADVRMMRQAQQNKHSADMLKDAHPNQRTNDCRNARMAKMAEDDPSQFAKILLDKLTVVYEQRQREKLSSDALIRLMQSGDVGTRSNAALVALRNTTLTHNTDIDDTDDSILDAHISKWDSSARTPLRSPGRYSPRPKSPENNRQHRNSAMHRNYHTHYKGRKHGHDPSTSLETVETITDHHKQKLQQPVASAQAANYNERLIEWLEQSGSFAGPGSSLSHKHERRKHDDVGMRSKPKSVGSGPGPSASEKRLTTSQTPSMPPFHMPTSSTSESNRTFDSRRSSSRRSEKQPQIMITYQIRQVPSAHGDPEQMPVVQRTAVRGRQCTLRQFKQHLKLKPNSYRCCFKQATNGEVKFVDISNDDQILPLWEGKIIADLQVQRMT